MPDAGAVDRSQTSSPMLRFENVVKRFGGFTAVDGVTLDIGRGEFFALLGPSGCGKTTLLRMVAGFETPDSGRLLLDGNDTGNTPPYERPVNMMFQSYALFPHLTVAGNVAFGLKQEGWPKERIEARVKEMLALVKLEQFGNRKPHQLSGGQRQRVALARALAKSPKVFLLDEPLAALDKKLRDETQFELMALQQRLGLTFIIVTHDQEEAMTMADRIGVMHQGKLVQVGTPGGNLRDAAHALDRGIHRRSESVRRHAVQPAGKRGECRYTVRADIGWPRRRLQERRQGQRRGASGEGCDRGCAVCGSAECVPGRCIRHRLSRRSVGLQGAACNPECF